MALGAAEIHEPAFGEQINTAVTGQVIAIYLRFDVHLVDAGRFVEPVHLNFVIEMANVTNNGLVFHLEDVFQRDDFAVAGAGDINIGFAQRVFDGFHFKPFHRSLQGVDGVNLGDDDA